jgi:hypothetical protein
MLRRRYLLLASVLAACTGRQKIELTPDRTALSSIHTLFIGDFGTTDGSDVVKEKVRVLLMNDKRFTVVDAADKADAILTGAVGVDASQRKGTTDYAGTGVLRLIEAETRRTIWVHEYKRGYMFGGSVSTRLAKQMVDHLLKDAGNF